MLLRILLKACIDCLNLIKRSPLNIQELRKNLDVKSFLNYLPEKHRATDPVKVEEQVTEGGTRFRIFNYTDNDLMIDSERYLCLNGKRLKRRNGGGLLHFTDDDCNICLYKQGKRLLTSNRDFGDKKTPSKIEIYVKDNVSFWFYA